jgi:hypothetical protein
MRVAIDGRTAGVHPDPTRLERIDLFDRARQGVAESESHASMLAADIERRP